jgi:glycosyltransferase involved in cell wall biosynthesis
MSPEYKILTLVGWEILKVKQDDKSRHPANLLLPDERYWFFKYWPKDNLKVGVMALGKNAIFARKILRFYFWTPFKALLRAFKYDLILCFHSQVGLPLAFMMWLLNIKTRLVIIDVEGFGRKHRAWQRWFISQALKRVCLVFYLAKIQKEDYAKYYPEILNGIEFLPLGVDLSRFLYTSSKTEDYILSIGYQGSDFRDWKTLINAYNLLKTKTKLVIVGRTNLLPGEIGNSSLENVEFVKMCSLPKVNEYVSKCRFVVLPLTERRQALGQMTLLGAMALGKAIIVPEVPGVKDYVRGNQDGIFYESGNAYDLKKKMQYLLDNPSVIKKLGKEAKNSADAKFSDKIMSIQMFEALKSRDLLNWTVDEVRSVIARYEPDGSYRGVLRKNEGKYSNKNEIASPSAHNDIQERGEIASPPTGTRNDNERKNEIASPAKRGDHNDKNDKPAPENILLLGFGYYPFRISGDKNFWFDLSRELSGELNKMVMVSVNSSPVRFEQKGNIWLYNVQRPFHTEKDEKSILKFQLRTHPLPWEIVERSATMLKLLPPLQKLIKLHNIKVIHLMDNFGFSTALVRLLFPKVRVYATAITYNTHNLPTKPYGSYQRIIFGNLDKLVVSCKAYRDRLIEHGFSKDKIEVIRWGIPITNRKQKITNRRKHPSTNKVVLWTGFTQQIREGSFQLSLSVAQKITSQKSSIDFVFAVKSESYDKAYEYFQNEHLRIVTTDSEKFTELLNRTDLLLAPVVRLRSIIAPPLTWIECMARGIPIISTQAPGVDEILIHNQTGFVAKSNEELESLIEKVLEDKDLMSEVSINAKELVKEKYNLKDIAQDYLRLWRENVGATLFS